MLEVVLELEDVVVEVVPPGNVVVVPSMEDVQLEVVGIVVDIVVEDIVGNVVTDVHKTEDVVMDVTEEQTLAQEDTVADIVDPEACKSTVTF